MIASTTDPKEMEGAKDLKGEDWIKSPECQKIAADLKQVLEGLMDHLFGECEKKCDRINGSSQ